MTAGKLATPNALLAHDLSDAQWTKSESSTASDDDCLEATHVPELGGWVLRHSMYAAYTQGVQAGQPGLVPGS
ncbi:hypothetical protein DF268_04700 [Streptomyces sp. V2]|uniref:DUF397 domain-containing protein n=1 Tax=Streptomyces niveiscabiei TaxID=164115 RepID=A0ABW9HPY1_9ACTN|nr:MULTISPECIES: hypothetical protein [Streptomyces]PWG14591.1 hypothetical protein DF268_04700 [Streptomyces sp. V2]